MANFEIVALDPTTPQLRAPGASDNYTLPRHIAGANITLTTAVITGAYTVTSADNGKLFTCTNTTFVTLPDIATVPAGFNVTFKNLSTGTNYLQINGTGSQYIDGATYIVLRATESATLVVNGSGWAALGVPLWGSSTHSAGYLRPTSTGQFSVALATNASATASFALALGYNAVASGSSSLAGTFSSASANYSTALGMSSGGSGSSATASGSLALNGRAGGNSSTTLGVNFNNSSYGATTTNAFAAAPYARAVGQNSIAIGAYSYAGNSGSIAIGSQSVYNGPYVSGLGAIAIGQGSNAIGNYSTALGRDSLSLQYGQFSHSAGSYNSPGEFQYSRYVLRGYTFGISNEVMTTDGSFPGSSNQIYLPDSTDLVFEGQVIGRSPTFAGYFGTWKISGHIRRDSGAGSTAIMASTVTPISIFGGGYNVQLFADTTYGGLRIEITGDPLEPMAWSATVHCTQATLM